MTHENCFKNFNKLITLYFNYICVRNIYLKFLIGLEKKYFKFFLIFSDRACFTWISQ